MNVERTAHEPKLILGLISIVFKAISVVMYAEHSNQFSTEKIKAVLSVKMNSITNFAKCIPVKTVKAKPRLLS